MIDHQERARIERLYDELMAIYAPRGRIVLDLRDRKAIERRRAIRERLDGCWGVVAQIRHERRARA